MIPNFMGDLKQQIQPNQYGSGNVSDPNSNTNWMTGDSGWASQGNNDITKNPIVNQGQPQQQNTQPLPNNGTAISAATNGWNGNTGVSGYGSNWMNPQQQQSNNPNPQQNNWTPQAGWDTNKLMDPNKHDPKYDWLRAFQATGSNGNDLSGAVNYYNQNYGGNARNLGGDKVDFGGDTGIVDTLFGHGAGINSPLWAPQSPNSGNNGAMGNQQGGGFNQNMLMQMMQMLFGQGGNQPMNQGDASRQYTNQGGNNYQPQMQFRNNFNNQNNQNSNTGPFQYQFGSGQQQQGQGTPYNWQSGVPLY